MKILENKYLLWGIIAVLVILFAMKSCEKGETTKTITVKPVEVEIPEQTGIIKSPIKKEERPVAQPDTVFIVGQAIYLPSPLDPELKKKLEQTENKYALLLDASRKRKYSEDFQDEFVDINVTSTVYGTADSTNISYKLKPRKVTVNETTITESKTLQSKLALFAGAQAQINSEGKITPHATIGLQLNSNTIIEGGYSTNGDITLGAKIRIFNINK